MTISVQVLGYPTSTYKTNKELNQYNHDKLLRKLYSIRQDGD